VVRKMVRKPMAPGAEVNSSLARAEVNSSLAQAEVDSSLARAEAEPP